MLHLGFSASGGGSWKLATRKRLGFELHSAVPRRKGFELEKEDSLSQPFGGGYRHLDFFFCWDFRMRSGYAARDDHENHEIDGQQAGTRRLGLGRKIFSAIFL